MDWSTYIYNGRGGRGGDHIHEGEGLDDATAVGHDKIMCMHFIVGGKRGKGGMFVIPPQQRFGGRLDVQQNLGAISSD